MSIEVMKQALEAYLEREMPTGTIIGDPKWWAQKIARVASQAIAAAEKQEPVAFEYFKDWMVREMPPMTIIGNPEWWAKRIYERFIHTHPQAREPLSEVQIATVYWGATGQSLRPQDNALAHKFARAIEAAHGIGEKK